MQLNINFRNVESSEDLIGYIERRLSFVFSRSRQDIDELGITISDINGPKGGVDQQCLVVIKPQGLSRFVITEKQEDIRTAIDRCLTRASQSLNRKLKRKQSLIRRRPIKEVLEEAPSSFY